jgi:3-mercaptopyruvate sulfurtransferase SseA
MLKERGVKNVRALTGGWNTWVNANGRVVTGKQ